MIKLIAIDLDGTFLSSDKQHLPENLAAVHAAMERGVKVVICTGRTLPGTRRFLEDLNFSDQDYLILQNGAAIHHLPHLELAHGVFQKADDHAHLIEVFKATQFADLQLVAFDQENLYLIDQDQANDYIKKDAETLATPITPIASQDFLNLTGIYKMMILGSPQNLDQWQESLPKSLHERFDLVRSQPIIVECLSKATNKATALQWLCQKLAIDAQDVMVLGDEQNDIEMLKWAGHSVAMGNAKDDIKAYAKHVTLTNNQAGVAAAIKKLVLQEL